MSSIADLTAAVTTLSSDVSALTTAANALITTVQGLEAGTTGTVLSATDQAALDQAALDQAVAGVQSAASSLESETSNINAAEPAPAPSQTATPPA
jgi:hypothetical protein